MTLIEAYRGLNKHVAEVKVSALMPTLLYRVTSHLDSYILLTSVLEVP